MAQAHTAHDVQAEVKRYIVIFAALMGLTIVTVAANYLHLNLAATVILALFIATIKASLVACYFMHLISERKLIYLILGFTVLFFIGLIGLLYAGFFDTLQGTRYVS